jgi:hypothetical protein
VPRFSIGLEVVVDKLADISDLGGGEFTRLPPGIYKLTNLVEGVDGNIQLDGIAGSRVILCVASKKKIRSGVVSR